MKKLLAFCCCISATVAWAEPAEYTFRVTPADVQVIGNALGARPFAEVQAIIGKLQSQIAEQSRPKPEPNPENKAQQ